MNGRSWREEWWTQTAVIAVIAVGLLIVVLAVFAYIIPMAGGRDAASAEGPGGAGGTLAAGEASPATGEPDGGPVGQVLPSPASDQPPTRYVNGPYGFEVAVPANWRRAEVKEAQRPALAADYDLVWEDPDTGARLAISAWDGSAATSFVLWAALMGSGMQPTDGEAPYNAMVAGRPALLVWAPETPTAPARYSLFFERDGTYFRVAYAALDGGAALTDYARALVSLRWPRETDSGAMLPLRGGSAGRYWPGERLFR